MKKFLIGVGSVVGITVIVIAVMMMKQTDSGLKRVKTYDAFIAWLNEQDNLIFTGVTGGGETPDQVKDFYETNRNYFLKISKGKPSFLHGTFCALLVKIGDKYVNYNGTYEQDAEVIKVYQGASCKEQERIDIVSDFATEIDEDKQVRVMIAYGQPPMKAGETYLLFCEETKTSKQTERFQYRVLVGANAYLNINNDMCLVADESNTVEEIMNCEYYVKSEEDISYLLDIKHEILANYGLGEE